MDPFQVKRSPPPCPPATPLLAARVSSSTTQCLPLKRIAGVIFTKRETILSLIIRWPYTCIREHIRSELQHVLCSSRGHGDGMSLSQASVCMDQYVVLRKSWLDTKCRGGAVGCATHTWVSVPEALSLGQDSSCKYTASAAHIICWLWLVPFLLPQWFVSYNLTDLNGVKKDKHKPERDLIHMYGTF